MVDLVNKTVNTRMMEKSSGNKNKTKKMKLEKLAKSWGMSFNKLNS